MTNIRPNSIIRTEKPRGYPPHRTFRVREFWTPKEDSLFGSVISAVARLARNGEAFPNVTKIFQVASITDAEPSVMRRALMEMLPFRGRMQLNWRYAHYCQFVKPAIADETQLQLGRDAQKGFVVDEKSATKLDEMRARVAGGAPKQPDVQLLANVLDVCIHVKIGDEWFSYLPESGGACVNRSVYLLYQAWTYVDLEPVALFSPEAALGGAATPPPETGFWRDRERFVGLMRRIHESIDTSSGYSTQRDGVTWYVDVDSAGAPIEWTSATFEDIRDRDVMPTERFYRYVEWRAKRLRTAFAQPNQVTDIAEVFAETL